MQPHKFSNRQFKSFFLPGQGLATDWADGQSKNGTAVVLSVRQSSSHSHIQSHKNEMNILLPQMSKVWHIHFKFFPLNSFGYLECINSKPMLQLLVPHSSRMSQQQQQHSEFLSIHLKEILYDKCITI